MKVEKIVILAIAICCLFITSSMQVAALEKSESPEDLENDVFDYLTQEIVTESQYIEVDNIDITNINYDITDTNIEFSITVKGKIEDRGTLDDFLGNYESNITSLNVDTVAYSFDLVTSEIWLNIMYVNNQCILTDELGEITNLSASDFSVSGDTLTVSFEWDTTNQTFEEATANSQYMRFMIEDINYEDLDESAMIWLFDQVPNGPLEVYAEATNLGEIGETIEFEGSAMGGNPPYTWLWEFGDGETSNEADPSHAYDEDKTYEYTLTVTDSTDESESYSGSIEIVKTGDDDTNDTPGFEILIAFVAIGLIFLWKRKR